MVEGLIETGIRLKVNPVSETERSRYVEFSESASPLWTPRSNLSPEFSFFMFGMDTFAGTYDLSFTISNADGKTAFSPVLVPSNGQYNDRLRSDIVLPRSAQESALVRYDEETGEPRSALLDIHVSEGEVLRARIDRSSKKSLLGNAMKHMGRWARIPLEYEIGLSGVRVGTSKDGYQLEKAG